MFIFLLVLIIVIGFLGAVFILRCENSDRLDAGSELRASDFEIIEVDA
jgi:hypothetical protein